MALPISVPTLLTRVAAAILLALPVLLAGPGSGLQRLSIVEDGSGYTPAAILDAYDIQPLHAAGIDGQGQTAALVELDSFRMSDIHKFDQAYGLDDPHIVSHYPGGKRFPLGSGVETTLDIEWLHAIAPAATIQVYYLRSGQSAWKPLASELRFMPGRGVGTVSISLGACHPGGDVDVARSALSMLLQQGVSIFASSGDSGAHPGPQSTCGSGLGVAYPAADPSVVAVGGTSLQMRSATKIGSETAWDRSGGGVARSLLRAAWESAPGMPKDAYRWAPDVSFLAAPSLGVRTYVHGNWHRLGGTSLGSPAWAGIWALLRQQFAAAGKPLGVAPQVLYQVGNSPDYSHAFHDVTKGGNKYYRAGPGWDPVTGWGTPDVARLSAAIAALGG